MTLNASVSGPRTRQVVSDYWKVSVDRRRYNSQAFKEQPRLRILSRVLIDNGCWNWLGQLNVNGYGRLMVAGRQVAAHRLVYELLTGPINEETLDHLCRNRRCVRPGHLEQVPNRVNVLRGVGVTARHARKSHCHRGHPLSGGNLQLDPDGHRQCRTCRKRTSESAYVNKKARKARADEHLRNPL